MRIALFSGNYNYIREGANQALNQLVGYLERAREDVRVYSPVTDTPAFEPQGTLVPVPSIPLPIRTEFRLAVGMSAAIRRDLEEFAPDIIHVSTPDILNHRAETFAIARGIPIVASLHTRFETYPQYYPGLRWLAPLAAKVQNRFYRRASHVLAPSAALVGEIKQLRGDDCASVWSRGIDLNRFDPARRDEEWRRFQGWTESDVVVLFFGRLVLEKGVKEYVSTVLRLREHGLKVRPLVVGAGPARDAFEALEDAVFTGHLDGAELGRAIASADVLLHPSRTEAFGNVVLEAMASGLAVVCARAESSEALVDDGRNGLLCDDWDASVRAVADLSNDAPRRKRMGAAARGAAQRFSWDEASASVHSVYRSLIAEPAQVLVTRP